MNAKLEYTVEFNNSLADLEKTGYQMPEHGPFDSLEAAKTFIAEEFEKAKALLLALPDGDELQFSEGPASKSIRCGAHGGCHWQTIETNEKGVRLIPTTFYPDDYVRETYGIKADDGYGIIEGMDIPYNGILFARSIEGKFKSYWKKDDGLPFDETLAKKLIDDPKVVVGTHFGYIIEKETGGSKSATDYILPYKNPESVICKPTIHAPVSDACNVKTDFTLEVLFAFDDGYLVPVRKSFGTRGSFSISSRDAMMDLLEDLDGRLGDVEDFFEDCGNFKKSEDGFVLYGFSEDGQQCNLEFDDSNYYEVRRALVSIRLVELTERITDRNLNEI